LANQVSSAANQFSLPFKPFFGDEPFARLIRATAMSEWKLILLNVGSSLTQAVFEAGALGVVFLTVKILAAATSAQSGIFTETPFKQLPLLSASLERLPSTGLVFFFLFVAIVLQLLQSIAKYLNLLSAGYFAARCRTLVSSCIYKKIFQLSFACASSYKVGDLIEYVNSAQDAIRTHVENSSLFFTGIVFSIMYLAVLVNISPWLLIGVALILVFIWQLQSYLLPRIASGAVTVTRVQVEVNSRIAESFQALRFLHTTGQTESTVTDLKSRLEVLEHQLRKQSRRLSILSPVLAFLPILAVALVASLALVLLGGAKAGILPGLITFVLSLQRLNANLGGMSGNLNILADNFGKLKRIDEILSEHDKQYRRSGGIRFLRLNHEIAFKSVSHSYHLDSGKVLDNLSFKLPIGQTLALVGSSGAGKSTIVDLLLGLYSPTAGNIFVDDTPLEELDLTSWQAKIGVVSQDIFLFNATISENLAFGLASSEASLDDIKSACVAASVDGFVESLPNGYNTVIGERGYRLSGGQRQRLALARALLKKPELLILDEATSALDSRTEQSIQNSLQSVDYQRTTMIIAHRLSTIVHADKIIVLDKGSVVEAGTHHELLNAKGSYHQLWSIQSQNSPASE
jgi:ATP-binding cassette subfamily B protein/subfamily B ATP-binding cassette protein MsbA